VPCGSNFRGAGSRSDQCLVKARVNKSFKSRFKNSEPLIRTVWWRVPDRRCWKSESTPGKVCRGEWQDQQRDGRQAYESMAADTFRDSVVHGKPEWMCSKLCKLELPTCMWSAAGLAVAAGAVTAWHGIASVPGAQSELHCCELAAVSGWCTMQSCQGSEYQLAGDRSERPKAMRGWGAWRGCPLPRQGKGLVMPPPQNSGFSWHWRKFCWQFYVLFLRCNCWDA